MNILLAIDSNLIARIISETLSTMEFHVTHCNTIKDSLLQSENVHFDFIITSKNLEDGDGNDLIVKLRNIDNYHNCPIVLLTSELSAYVHLKALQSGATDVFLKQNLDELFNYIKRLQKIDSFFEGNILYVEDSPAQAKPMIQILENHGLKVDWFETAEQAIQVIQNNQYDLVLTDVVLRSSMQGTMFAMHIRRLDGDVGDIPILALTAYDKIDSRIALFQIGIDDYVSKPVVEAELLPRIYRLIERKRLINALREKEEQAEKYTKAKSSFLAHICHEIRTPISGVIAAAELLENTKLDHEQYNLVKILNESSKVALTILSDVLDLSKIEEGKLTIENIATNLHQIIENAIRTLLPKANSKKIEIFLFVTPDLPSEVIVDPTRLTQILLNLLSNAIKFSGNDPDVKGVIKVRIDKIEFNGEVRFKICVKDNGIGINEEIKNKLFDPFVQGEDATYRKYGGTGLGLNIVKTLVQLMNGEITLNSAIGEGSEFCVSLPLTQVKNSKFNQDAGILNNTEIAVFSRNNECASLLTSYANSAGAIAVAYPDPDEFCRKIKSGLLISPDLILIDLDTDQKRNLNLPINLNIVELLAPSEIKVFERSMALSSRPLFYSDFIDAICSIQSIERKAQALPENHKIKINSKNLQILLAEDNKINQELFKIQFDLIGIDIVIANDGLEALDLWRKQRFALIMTDCDMPNMDGYDLTKAIRSEEAAGDHAIIIAITANAFKGDVERCLNEGMDDYISKPTTLISLKNMLTKWIDE